MRVGPTVGRPKPLLSHGFPRSHRHAFDLGRFLAAEEEGTQVFEVLLIVTFAVVPAIAGTFLFIDTLKEYLGYEITVITSPFF